MLPRSLLIARDLPDPGPWAVGVSGGADSVALLHLLHQRPDLHLHVVHLNHQTRGPASDADAAFVSDLAAQLHLPLTLAQRTQLEPFIPNLPQNPSARYRAARLALFRQAVEQHGLQGVLLAHHADDQAETILHRLLRGSVPSGLAGMRDRAVVNGLPILRPLLRVSRRELRNFLQQNAHPWREDASNQSPRYARNRLRHLLSQHPALTDALLELGRACAALAGWIKQNAATLPDEFPPALLHNQPACLAQESARRWLAARGVPQDDVSPKLIARLLALAADAASPSRQHFPGQIQIRRRQGRISAAAPLHREDGG
jgi:tRNA(Ile)-lysidine synthetase-like protein